MEITEQKIESKDLPVIDLDKEFGNNGHIVKSEVKNLPKIVDPRPAQQYKKLEFGFEAYEEANKRFMTLTEYLESQDPSYNYEPVQTTKGKFFPDAFERQLIVRGLSIYGRTAAQLDAFFQNNSTNRVLFPEFVSRNIRIGQQLSRLDVRVADLVALEQTIQGGTYKSADVSEVSADDASLKNIAEGGAFPGVLITAAEVEVGLRKYGRKIKGTYEYLRRVQLPVFALVLQFIGIRMEKTQTDDAIDVLINGNPGNSNAAGNTNTAVSGTLTYNDLVQLFLDMGSADEGAFDLRLLIMNRTNAKTVLAMDEFADTAAGNTFAQTGNLYSPLGAAIKLHDGLANDIVLGVDERQALIKVVEGGSQLTETQRFPDGQFTEFYISEVMAFVKNFAKAARTLDIVWP
jgi:hypothetical protein